MSNTEWKHVFTDHNSCLGGDNLAEVSNSFEGPDGLARDTIYSVWKSDRNDTYPYYIEEMTYEHENGETERVGDIYIAGSVIGYRTVEDALEAAKKIAEQDILLELEFLNS